MPIFNFMCTKCKKTFEKIVLHKVDSTMDDEVEEILSCGCTECGGTVVRVAGVPNLKFVGKDFYVNEERARREKQRIAKDVDTAKRNISISESKNGDAKTAKG